MAKLPYNIRLCLAVLLTSFFAGLSGILMHELLNVVEWLAYGKSMENFLSWIVGWAYLPNKTFIYSALVCFYFVRL